MSAVRALSRVSAMAALLMSLAVATGCEEEGPAEEAGEAIDNTAEEAGDAAEDAVNR